jgi:hypothetical protein
MQSTFKFVIMKKHHIILGCSLIFLLLFYKESLGVNLAIFGLVLTSCICYFFQDRFTERTHLILVVSAVLSCLAFAWYGDFASFLALALSLLFLQFKTQDPKLKIILVFPLVFLNGITSIGRIFIFKQWLPEGKIQQNWLKKLIAYFVIPALFLVVFFAAYCFGSDHFSALLTDYRWDFDFGTLVVIGVLGFYISFSFWNYWVPDVCYDNAAILDNDFSAVSEVENKNTFSFLDLDFERKSGVISLLLLNAMLLVFIVTYNYEQFFQVVDTSKLSAATHERVNAVVLSIVMAVGVILFYFKGGFNFDQKAASLKKLAKIWILLNGVLILSTMLKNAEYISFYGLTYKRLGVFAFLLLALIGLVFTFLKISKQKTNAYLFNQTVWCFYGTLLFCSFINWGDFITAYNISVNKGVEPAFLNELNFNDQRRNDYFKQNQLEGGKDERDRKEVVASHKKQSFLSKALYYDFVGLDK